MHNTAVRTLKNLSLSLWDTKNLSLGSLVTISYNTDSIIDPTNSAAAAPTINVPITFSDFLLIK
ncbi:MULTISPECIES: hypothetical protein [Niallia]|uniref:hypothetical protein n=1 Tax=Niallia TaxID=2837506 RepID=UPI0015F6B0F8|nr:MULTISPECIES: hypothetical protein [Niallia]UPO91281.1 hypothetical protein L8T27_027550 [Niallia sp. Man26]GKU84325.1 hypothetical protein NCCP28_37210 [Niallia sp. NCCP-28]